MRDDEMEATLAALRRWGFPIEEGPNWVEQAFAALKSIDEAHDVLYPQQHELLSILDYADDPQRVGAFYFGLFMQAGAFAARDAASGGQA